MNFEEIKPFIRYTSRLKPSLATDEKTLKAYDNCIVYALSGEGKIIVEDTEYTMSTGSVLMWRANQSYRICASEQEPESNRPAPFIVFGTSRFNATLTRYFVVAYAASDAADSTEAAVPNAASIFFAVLSILLPSP